VLVVGPPWPGWTEIPRGSMMASMSGNFSSGGLYRERRGLGCVVGVLGTAPLALGLLLSTVVIDGMLRANSSRSPGELACWIGASLVFLGLAAVMIVGRKGVDIDVGAGVLRRWRGVLVPIFRTERPLSEFDRVVVVKNERHYGGGHHNSRSHTRHTFQPGLAGPSVQGVIRFGADADHGGALMEADAMAVFLRLPVEDRSGETAVLRPFETLDTSVREQVLESGERHEAPDELNSERLTVSRQSDSVKVGIAPVGVSWASRRALLAALVAAPILAVFMIGPFGSALALWSRGGVWPVLAVILAAIAVLLVVGPPVVIASAVVSTGARRETLDVSRAGLRRTVQGLFGADDIEVRAEEVLSVELETFPGAGWRPSVLPRSTVAVRTRTGSVRLGGALTEPEQAWLRQLLLHHLG
jgi:hypothetical protein